MTKAKKEGTGLLTAMSSTKFRHGSWYSPVLTAVWLYAVAAVITKIPDARTTIPWVDVPWAVLPVLLAAVVAPVAARMHMTSEVDVSPEIARRAGWYALACVLTGGGWLLYSLAATAPDDVFPAGFGWLVCVVILVGPWYGLLRRRKRVVVAARMEERRIQRAVQYQSDWSSIMAAAGFPGMTVLDKLGTRSGYVLTMEFPADSTNGFDEVKSAEKQIGIAAAHRLVHQGVTLRPGAIRVEQVAGDVRHVLIHVRITDVLNVTLSMPDVGVEMDVADGIEIGLYEDGSPIVLPMVGRHTEVIGATGSGKSAVVKAIFTRLSQCPNAQITVAATSKLFPLVGPWCAPWWENPASDDNPDGVNGPIFDMIGGQDLPDAAAVLLYLYQLVDERSRIRRKGDKLAPTKETPLVVGVLEESMSMLGQREKFTAHNGRKMTLSNLAQQITQLGRSELVHLLRVDQFGLMDSAGDDGNKIRRNTLNRICLQTAFAYDGQAVLGPGAPDTTQLVNNTLLAKLEKKARPVAGKSYYVEDDPEEAAKLGLVSVADVAIAHDKFRSEQPAKVARLLGPVYTERWTPARIAQLLEYKASGGEQDDDEMPVAVAAAAAPEQKGSTAVNTEESGPKPANPFAPPDVKGAFMASLRKQGIDPAVNPDAAAPASGGTPAEAEPRIPSADEWDEWARNLNGGATTGESSATAPKNPSGETPPPSHRVPEPLAALVASYLLDGGAFAEHQFAEYTEAAARVNITPASELVRRLAAEPFNLPVQRPSAIQGRPRGWWFTDLIATATRLRDNP